MRKRILSALLAVLFLITSLPGAAWAVGEGNMEAGGGQTETVTGDSFWNGQWGIRFCVVDVVSQSVVSATYDASNYGGLSNYWHYGKTNKFDYRNGATLTIRQGNYTLETPAVSIPTIVRTSGAPDIKAIKDYFTDETVIRWIGDVTGMAYDTLISGDYKLFIEPILYYTFDSQKYAMTATEAALFDRAINGLLLRTMGNATHQQLPLSLYLEKSDLGFSKWSGAKTGIQNDTNIINYLGMGIVSFIPEEDPEPGTGGDGDGPTVPISFRKTDPERFNAANYNTGLITFAPASSNSAAFDNISGAVIEISGDGTGAGTYELPCTVELGEGTFTVREVTPPYGYLLNDAWSAEITVEVEKDEEGKPVEGAEAEATITVSGGGGTDGTSYASVEDYRQRGQLTVTKVDNETISLNHGNYRTPQGDATFAGAVFELRAAKDIYLPSTWIKIYSEGDLVATAVTGNDGSFTINGIEQGVYTLQEITPSDGYVFQGAKARGQIYTITNAYTGSGTNILSFDDKAAGDTGNKNQYANTVIKADLTLTKFNENRTVENEMDGNAYEMNKQPAEGVYFAVYLNSKAAAGGNPIYSTTDDPVGDGTSGSASTAGWGYLDLVNHNFYSPLPDEWFKQRDLDANILPPDIYRKGTKIRDYIAPSAFHFKPNHTELGGYFNRVLFVNGYSNSLDDEFISSLMDNRFKVTVAKHVDHVDKEIVFQQINARMRALESDRQTRNQRNARNGTNYIPFFLQSQIDACRGMMKDLQEAEELFRVGLYISISAHSMEELEDITKVIIGACRQHLVSVKRATMRQEDGLASILPLGQDRLQLAPYMMTSGLSMLLPFTYASVSQPHGLYYGKNTLSGAPLILDRKEAKNGNSFIIAKPGAGKSMHAKIEINNVLFSTHLDQIIAIDPEREFVELCRAHGGTVIRLAPGTESHINPLDAGRDNGRNEDFLLTKADMLQSLLAVFKGSRLTAAEKSLVDRTLREVYKPYVSGGYRSEDMPTLREFYNIIKENDQPEAKDLALTLEMYVFGTVDLFAHPTNVDMRNRFIVFDVRDLGANLKKAGMLIALDYIQNQLIANKEAGINTWLYADEFHLFYSDNEDENSAGIFFERVFARCRKYGGLATGITQNVTNVMASQSALSMLQNCQFVVLLDQAGENLRQLISLYDLSDQ